MGMTAWLHLSFGLLVWDNVLRTWIDIDVGELASEPRTRMPPPPSLEVDDTEVSQESDILCRDIAVKHEISDWEFPQ